MTWLNFLFSMALLTSADLAPLDQILVNDNFEAAFKTRDLVRVENKSCVAKICDAYESEYVVKQLNDSMATVVTQQLNGTKISESNVYKSDWEQNGHNLVRFRIRNLNSYGFEVEVGEVTPSKMSVLVNGKMQTLETWVVHLEGKNRVGLKTKINLEITAGQTGLAQVLRSTEEKLSGVDSIEVKEIIYQ